MTTATAPTNDLTKQEPGSHESNIDRESHFNGLYETRQNLRIEGVAEGEIQCEGTLTVAEGARVKAKVTASTITIAGELEGSVVCRGVFQIMPSGQVDATVSARRLIVQEGGFYNGEFHMISDEVKDPTPEPAFTKPARPSVDEPMDEQPSLAEKNGLLSTDEWWSKLSGNDSATTDPERDTA